MSPTRYLWLRRMYLARRALRMADPAATTAVGFEEVLAGHPNGPLRMAELCALIGVSDRNLRSCCAEFLGISPTRSCCCVG
jgi:AraC-like DNA-binding protein